MLITFDVPVIGSDGDSHTITVYGKLYGLHAPATDDEPECRKEFDLEYYEPQSAATDPVKVSVAAEEYIDDNYYELLGLSAEEDEGFYYE